MARRRTSTRPKTRKRFRNGKFVTSRRPTTKTRVTVKRRRGVRKVNTLSARAFFDASRWHHRPELRVPDRVSEYTPVRGVHRVDINGPTAAGGSAIYVFFRGHRRFVVACGSHINTRIQNPIIMLLRFLFLASHSQAAGPQLCRPLRQSVAIRNISASQDVAGVVRVLSTNHPLSWVLRYGNGADVANVNIHQYDHANVVSMIGSHPQTRTITNAELRAGVTIPMIPASLAEYKEYHEWHDIAPIANERRTEPDGSLIMIPGEMSAEHMAGKLVEEYSKKNQ